MHLNFNFTFDLQSEVTLHIIFQSNWSSAVM